MLEANFGNRLLSYLLFDKKIQTNNYDNSLLLFYVLPNCVLTFISLNNINSERNFQKYESVSPL